MSKKKILFLSSWYPVPNNPTHGIFVKRHAEAVSMLNEVYALYVYGSESLDEEVITHVSENFTEHLIQYKKNYTTSIGKYHQIKNIYEKSFKAVMEKHGRPDIIHLNVIFPAGIFALHLSNKYNIPLVITEHWTGYLPEDGSYQGIIKKYFTKKVVQKAKIICPVTMHLEDNMRRHGLTGNYKTIPNVVDTEFFNANTISNEGLITFFHLSSLDERQKNPVSIIDSFLNIHKKHSNARLILAGDGENLNKLQKKYSHPSIEYYFRPLGEKLLKLYQRCDVFVLNSRYENLPVVLLEAMSCGKPVISSNVGGISEYINESNGILFSTSDVANLSVAMEKYIQIKYTFDAKTIRSLAIKSFSKKSIAACFDKIYNELI